MFENEPELNNGAISINKFVVAEQTDFNSMGLPPEAMALLNNIQEDKKKIVLTGQEDPLAHLSQFGIPEEAMKLIQDLKTPKETKKSKTEDEPLIPKLSFNPDSGFTMSADMLAKLNLIPPTASSLPGIEPVSDIKPESPVSKITPQEPSIEKTIDFGPSIDISVTSNYTPEESTALVRNFNINEEGLFLGIIIGNTTKPAALEILSKYSSFKFDENTPESILSFDDISITVYFDDENIVNQLEFGRDFRGHTSKGLKIGDTLEDAINLYGPPKMKSPRGAMWNEIKVFFTDGQISSIKIQK